MWHQPPGTDVCITFKFSLMRGRFIGSPTGGPNDVVYKITYYTKHYGVAGDGDLIPQFLCLAHGNLPSGIAMPCLVETAPGRSLQRSSP